MPITRMLRRFARAAALAMVAHLPAVLAPAVLERAVVAPARAGDAPLCGGRDLLAPGGDADLAARLAAVPRAVNGEAVFWRLTPPGGGAPSHLLGTIHLGDPRVLALPGPVAAAFAAARVLAVENVASLDPNPDGAALQRVLPLLVYTDGRSLRDLLAPAEVDALMGALRQRGLPGWMFLGWRPWAVAFSALAQPACEMRRLVAGGRFLDGELVARARAGGKPVADLEAQADQLGAMAAVQEAVQVALLRASLALEPRQDDLHETMVQLYLRGRSGDLLALGRLLLADAAAGVALDELWHLALDRRNAQMFDRARSLVDAGGAFLAVGAGHLGGETGLVARFAQAGYRVDALR